jgi:hypothetical protein
MRWIEITHETKIDLDALQIISTCPSRNIEIVEYGLKWHIRVPHVNFISFSVMVMIACTGKPLDCSARYIMIM